MVRAPFFMPVDPIGPTMRGSRADQNATLTIS